jgi:hypothetical protein
VKGLTDWLRLVCLQVVASDGKIYDRQELKEYLDDEPAVTVSGDEREEDEQDDGDGDGGGDGGGPHYRVRAPDGQGWIRQDSTMEFSEATAKRVKAWLREVAWAAFLETEEKIKAEVPTEVRPKQNADVESRPKPTLLVLRCLQGASSGGSESSVKHEVRCSSPCGSHRGFLLTPLVVLRRRALTRAPWP